MIPQSSYEELFLQGVEVCKQNYGDEDTALIFIQKFVDQTFIEDEYLPKAIEGFKKRDLHEVRVHIHTLKGRLGYFPY